VLVISRQKGKTIGFIQLTLNIIIMVLTTLILPVSLWLEEHPDVVFWPELYAIGWFNWRVGIFLVTSFFNTLFAGVLIYFGLQMFRSKMVVSPFPTSTHNKFEKKSEKKQIKNHELSN
jgi:uncharacterized membrane-anchored protein YitT (DUF2179 family)